MKKRTKIVYDPYNNSLEVKTVSLTNGSWEELPEDSKLGEFLGKPTLFSNCAVDIVKMIDSGQNSSAEGLEIEFCGTDADYALLSGIVSEVDGNRVGSGPLSCFRAGSYESAENAIAAIRSCYGRIASEFKDYVSGGEKYRGHEEIGDRIARFEETVSEVVPVCIVGNYSVGKSALINAIVGNEIMPSDVDPSTARNVKVVHNPGEYAITLERQREDGEVDDVRLIVADGIVRLDPDGIDKDGWYESVLQALNTHLGPMGESAYGAIYCILDYLNRSHDEVLEDIGMNVFVEAPFVESVVTNMGRSIALYDTPGSNNASINQEDHKAALKRLMSEQTNALPVIVTTKDTIRSNDLLELRNMLYEYQRNFSSLNSVIVLAKCDLLSAADLSKPIDEQAITWYGKSPVVYITAVGALGERKGNNPWINEGLAEHYDNWARRYASNPETRCLPKYNMMQPAGHEELDVMAFCSKELFATGVPSLECEIARYAREYADYKKCSRGRDDLLAALAEVKDEIARMKELVKSEKAKSEARKRKKKDELVTKLDAIEPDDLFVLEESLVNEYAPRLREYLSGLKRVIAESYDDATDQSQGDPTEQVYRTVRDHCQEKLIDDCYLGEGGIRSQIETAFEETATQFAGDLHQFIEGNDSHFTEIGRAKLEEYARRGSRLPIMREIESALPPLESLLQVVSVLQFAICKAAGNEREARRLWVDSKYKHIKSVLEDEKQLFGHVRRGLFFWTTIVGPLSSYSEQLRTWASDYKSLIRECLDDENSYLSGMEAEITAREKEISDLSDRIERLATAEQELMAILDMTQLNLEGNEVSHG